MAEVKKVESASVVKSTLNFIGRAWKNTTKDGREFMRLTIDRGIQVSLNGEDRIELWPNTKRDGKKDADFRASIRTA